MSHQLFLFLVVPDMAVEFRGNSHSFGVDRPGDVHPEVPKDRYLCGYVQQHPAHVLQVLHCLSALHHCLWSWFLLPYPESG